MMPIVIQIVAGVVGTVGFAILFRLKPLHCLYAGVVGLFVCIVYCVLDAVTQDPFISNFIGAFVCAVFSDVFARIAKAPATVFILPGIITLVPGRTLYYAMSNLLNDKYVEAGQFLLTTVTVAVAIGGGLIAASVLRLIVSKLIENVKRKVKK